MSSSAPRGRGSPWRRSRSIRSRSPRCRSVAPRSSAELTPPLHQARFHLTLGQPRDQMVYTEQVEQKLTPAREERDRAGPPPGRGHRGRGGRAGGPAAPAGRGEGAAPSPPPQQGQCGAFIAFYLICSI
jgi:hypothetical protein